MPCNPRLGVSLTLSLAIFFFSACYLSSLSCDHSSPLMPSLIASHVSYLPCLCFSEAPIYPIQAVCIGPATEACSAISPLSYVVIRRLGSQATGPTGFCGAKTLNARNNVLATKLERFRVGVLCMIRDDARQAHMPIRSPKSLEADIHEQGGSKISWVSRATW